MSVDNIVYEKIGIDPKRYELTEVDKYDTPNSIIENWSDDIDRLYKIKYIGSSNISYYNPRTRTNEIIYPNTIGGYIDSKSVFKNKLFWVYANSVVLKSTVGSMILDGVVLINSHITSYNLNIYNNISFIDSTVVFDKSLIDYIYKLMLTKHGEEFCGVNIQSPKDYLVIGPLGSRNGTTLFYKTKSGINVKCGCFHNTIEEFKDAVEKKYSHEQPYSLYTWIISDYYRQYNNAIEYAKKELE